MLSARSLTAASTAAHTRQETPTAARSVLACITSSQILPPALVRAGRSQAIAAIVAHAGVGLPMSVLSLVADAGLVLFAIDDLFDDSGLTFEEGSLRVAQYTEVARGEPCPEVAFDPVAQAIVELRRRLVVLAPDAIDVWADAMAQMLAGMGAELRGGPPATDLDDYLASARDSIGVEMIALTAFLATDADSTLAMLPALRRAERSFSTGVRLANDLRTCDRERVEGRENAVTLVGDEGRPLLRALCERSLADGRGALTRAGIERTPQGRFLERFATAIVSMYRTHDFEQAAA